MRVATDIGGTFTDLVYLNDKGEIFVDKDHTTPGNFEEGIINVMNKSRINFSGIENFIHGSTIVINTLTEKKGDKVGLITTKGTRDVLEIARGNRPDLYNFNYKKPQPFVERYLRKEVTERLNYKGEVITPLVLEEVTDIVQSFINNEVKAIAITFLHSYINPIHEKLVTKYIREKYPDILVIASHEISNEWREYERTNTTVLSSYVQPTVSNYIKKLEKKLLENNVYSNKYIMQSNGGMADFQEAKNNPIQLVESGPVAGVFGAQVLGNLIGESNIIAFDVGGTTAKCSLIHNGEVKITTDYFIERDEKNAGYPIKAPVVDIVEIGNGGGSIAWIDEVGALQVGPESAGSYPGPVAYGLGGQKVTTTDAHLVTGRLSAKNFEYQVNIQEINKILKRDISEKFNVSNVDAALGIIQIANSNMLNALRLISVRKGHDPSDFSLIAYGGGGAMHAAYLGRELNVKKTIIPNSSAVFSAWGMLQSDLRTDSIQTYVVQLSSLNREVLNEKWNELIAVNSQKLLKQGVPLEKISFTKYLDMRYVGQEHTVKILVPEELIFDAQNLKLRELFHELHEKTYQFKLEDSDIEIVSLHLVSIGEVDKITLKELDHQPLNPSALIEKRKVYFDDDGWIQTPIYNRDLLVREQVVLGPAIVEEKQTSTLIYPKQKVTVDNYGNLIIEEVVV